MLKNRYQEILVGMGPMSLIRGLISRKRNRSTLLIDDDRFVGESYHQLFLSELEVLALIRLGKRYEIPEIQDLRQFLMPAKLEYVSNYARLKLGSSPFENLRELLRKYPDLCDASDLDMLFADTAENFNSYFLEELVRYESLCCEMSMRPKAVRFELQGPKWFKTVYLRFADFLNKEYSNSRNLKYSTLLHLLGIAAEEKLKTRLTPEEVPFYFFRALSPIYRLQDFFLTTQLKRRLLLLGGDFKHARVQYWQFHQHRFENLLLESFEGVISGDRVLFFSHLPQNVPFGIKSPYQIFRKAQMKPLKRPSSPYPPADCVFLAQSDSLGSDRPFRTLTLGDWGLAHYEWPYPELPGSKAEFYAKAMTESFNKDSLGLPFQVVPAEAKGTETVTLDLREVRDLRKSESPINIRLPLAISEGEIPIQGFEYWGPFRYRSLGLLSMCYGIEGI